MSFILDALKHAEKAAREGHASFQPDFSPATAMPTRDDCLAPCGKDFPKQIGRDGGYEPAPDFPRHGKDAGVRGLPGQRRIAYATIAVVLLLAVTLAMGLWLGRGSQKTVSTRQSVANGSLVKSIGTVNRATPTAPELHAGPLRSENLVLRGEIAHHLNIAMRLLREGSKLSGSYYYVRIGKDIRLSGTIDDGGTVLLEEFVNGEKTGTFRGRFVSNERMEGTWSKPGSTTSRDFFLLNTD